MRAASGVVLGIDLHGLGGECHHGPIRGELARIGIAWAGVLAQGALWIAAYVANLGPIPLPTGLLNALLGWNLVIEVINLLPIDSVDGGKAWQIIPYLLRRKKERLLRRKKEGTGERKSKPRRKDSPYLRCVE